ncbi:hypothetical protein KSP40_PGU016692 [Platanthera guangdongensis]|uniref:Uncharacterized protein n=1 Tax=Platanthera guangdongensis TaxID=2320717 RepID=A0ABR2LGM2_9ASPA
MSSLVLQNLLLHQADSSTKNQLERETLYLERASNTVSRPTTEAEHLQAEAIAPRDFKTSFSAQTKRRDFTTELRLGRRLSPSSSHHHTPPYSRSDYPNPYS